MSVQTVTRSGDNREQVRLVRSVLLTTACRTNDLCKAFFTRFFAALDKSRRRQAARVLREYRHLIDDGND